MKLIIFYLTTSVLFVISLFPFWLLYSISTGLAWIIQYIIRYRKDVAFNNLSLAFPNTSNKEKNTIISKYYRNLSDLILEIIKVRTTTYNTIDRRVRFLNPEVFEELYKAKKSSILIMGHCGNWEWMTMKLERICKQDVYGVVKPLSDRNFDSYLTKIRTKFKNSGGLISFKSTYRELLRNREDITINVMAGDQTPTKGEINFWTPFFNQDTPVFLGTEKMAIALDFAVYFLDIQREKRGYYTVEAIEITTTPKETEKFEITQKHVQLLEDSIRRNPDNWLWSHRRWKHKKES